jgi:hypothetical protein
VIDGELVAQREDFELQRQADAMPSERTQVAIDVTREISG